MAKIFSFLLMLFLVVGCFGATEEDATETNGIENGEEQVENGPEEEGNVEYLSCSFEEGETLGEYRVRFINGQITDMNGFLTVYYPDLEGRNDFDDIDEFVVNLIERIEKEYREIPAADVDVYHEDDVINVELHFDFSRMEKTTEGYYSYFYDDGDKIFESITIDELREEIDGENVVCD